MIFRRNAAGSIHCTDGHDFVADLVGCRQQSVGQMRLRAEQVVLGVMERIIGRFDCSTWQDEVYDPKGRRVWVQALIDVDANLQSLREEETTALKRICLVQAFELHRRHLRPACQEPAQTEFGAYNKRRRYQRGCRARRRLRSWLMMRLACWRA